MELISIILLRIILAASLRLAGIQQALQSDADLDNTSEVSMIGMPATVKHKVCLLAISQVPPHVLLQSLDVRIVESRLDDVQHLDCLEAGCRTELVLLHNVQHCVYQVSAQNDTDLLDRIEFLIFGDAMELVAKKFHGAHAAHTETLDYGTSLVGLICLCEPENMVLR